MKKLLASLILVGCAFAQAPQPRPEPSAQSYALSELQLLPSYTAQSVPTGSVFNLAKAPKFWYDSSKQCDSGQSTYHYVAGVEIKTFTISDCDAAQLNVPVRPTFPAVASAAASPQRFGGVMGVDGWLQGNLHDQESTYSANQSVNISSAAAQAQLSQVASNTCAMLANNHRLFGTPSDPDCDNPAPLLAQYSAVLAHWVGQAQAVQAALGSLPGTPCPYCVAAALPATPTPVRALYPDEQIVGQMIGDPLVVRTAVPVGTPAPSGSGTFTDADRAALQQVLQILKSLTGAQ